MDTLVDKAITAVAVPVCAPLCMVMYALDAVFGDTYLAALDVAERVAAGVPRSPAPRPDTRAA